MAEIPGLPETVTVKTWQVFIAAIVFVAGASAAFFLADLTTQKDHDALARRVNELVLQNEQMGQLHVELIGALRDEREEAMREYTHCLTSKLNQMLVHFDTVSDIWLQIELMKFRVPNDENAPLPAEAKRQVYSQKVTLFEMQQPEQSGEMINRLQFGECRFKT